MASGEYHEPPSELSTRARDRHRAINSIIEELEAIDWYEQRAELCVDPELRAILIHNRNEEVEHAMMLLEWLRRRDETIDHQSRQYLFTKGVITEIEEASENGTKAAAPLAGPQGLGLGGLRGPPVR